MIKDLSNRQKYLAFFIVFALAVLVRLYNLSAPPFDQYAHSYRQSLNLSTIEHFYKGGINILYPQANYKGYPGYFVLEFPLFQAASAMLWKIFGPVAAVARLLNIALGMTAALLTYLIASRLFNRTIAGYAIVIFLFMPLNIMYHRSFLSEPLVVALALLALFQTLIWLEKKPKRIPLFIAMVVVYSLVAVIKPLYLMPVIVFLAADFFKTRRVPFAPIIAGLVAGAALAAWSNHVATVNGQYFFTRGLNLILDSNGLGPVFSLGYYAALGWRLLNNYLNPVGFALIVVFLVALPKLKFDMKRNVAIIFVLAGLYLSLFAQMNRPHNYYQMILMPFLAMIAALGVDYLVRAGAEADRRRLALAVLFSFIIATGYVFMASRLFALDQNLLTFQATVRDHLKDDGLVVVIAGHKRADTLGNLFGLQLNNVYQNPPAYMYATGKDGLFITATQPEVEKLYKTLESYYPHIRRHLKYIVLQDLEKRPSIMSRAIAKKLELTLVFSSESTYIYRVGRN